MNKLLLGLLNEGNKTTTENGALTNISTFNYVLDFFYHAAPSRGDNRKITNLFAKAYAENKLYAVVAAFYLRDIRGGQGERESFKHVLQYIYKNDENTFNKIVHLVTEYGRWDDILEYTNSDLVIHLVRKQLTFDVVSDTPSLLAKWMPSQNASAKDTISLANKWIDLLDVTPKQYRKVLSTLRAKINVVERHMSSNNFKKIDYARVPSRAAMIYRKAFSKQDADRYVAYLADVKSGKTKINAATIYPYEIVEKYLNAKYETELDETLEAQWKALPNYCVDNDSNALVVADTSGSMMGKPMAVSISLAMYIAERNTSSVFKDHFITFSESPKLERIIGNNLKEKINNLGQSDWGMSTNLQAVFDLILNTGRRNLVAQADMPKKIYVISDMEFNQACEQRNHTNFDVIKSKYQSYGYEMPTLIFWNVASRNLQTPVTKDEAGTFLVSGLSASIFKNTINAIATNPEEMMLEVLNSDRYAPVVNALVSK